MAEQVKHEVQRFRPTNGRLTGVTGLLLCLVLAGVFAVSGSSHVAVPGVLACAFAAVLVWLAMLRPSVAATESELRMRTLFETVSIPMASIETVVVRRYLLVRSGGVKYICPAISRSLRKTVRSELKWRPNQLMMPGAAGLEERFGEPQTDAVRTGVQEKDLAYADFVEERIRHLAAGDRARRGIEERSEEEYELGSQVVRRVAWLELGVLAALAIGFVLAIALIG